MHVRWAEPERPAASKHITGALPRTKTDELADPGDDAFTLFIPVPDAPLPRHRLVHQLLHLVCSHWNAPSLGVRQPLCTAETLMKAHCIQGDLSFQEILCLPSSWRGSTSQGLSFSVSLLSHLLVGRETTTRRGSEVQFVPSWVVTGLSVIRSWKCKYKYLWRLRSPICSLYNLAVIVKIHQL